MPASFSLRQGGYETGSADGAMGDQSRRLRMLEAANRFVAPVVASRRLTPTTHAIVVEKPESFRFQPTQFTFLNLHTAAGAQARPMSLASSPTRPTLEYAVRLSPSPFKEAFAALRPGDPVAILGPLGDFVLDASRPAVLVAGGIGITPFKGMAEYASDRALPIPVRLVYSNRSEDEIAYRAELKALETSNRRFRVMHTLTGAAGAEWAGVTGRIDEDTVMDAARDLDDPVYYISGRPTMVMDTIQQLRELRVPETAIRVEAFRGYA